MCTKSFVKHLGALVTLWQEKKIPLRLKDTKVSQRKTRQFLGKLAIV